MRLGGDIRAARIAGFNVKGILFFVYIFSGTMAGIAGVTYMILMRAADPSVLMGSEMMVIAAVVMGGTRITGGHGTVIGTILGVTLIALVKNNLIMLGVPAHYQTFVVGLIMIIGTSITSLKAKHIATVSKYRGSSKMQKITNIIKKTDRIALALLVCSVIITVLMGVTHPKFLGKSNLQGCLIQIPEYGILAFGMMIAMIAGELIFLWSELQICPELSQRL